MNVGHCLDSKN